MTIGIISYAVPSGLGQMAREIRTHLDVPHQLVIANHDFSPAINLQWAEGQHINGWRPDGRHKWDVQAPDLEYWIKENKITTVISVESSFGDSTFKWCRDLGCKVVLIVMWEFYNLHDPRLRNVDLYACPSFRCFAEIPMDNKKYIPWPVSTTDLPFIERSGPAKLFVHNAGTGGMYGRKGTRAAMLGFAQAAKENKTIELIVRCQMPITNIVPEWEAIVTGCNRIKIDYGSKPTVAELYATGDVLLYPALLDGHALVPLESMCSGMPVIVTDAAPINELWPTVNPLAARVERTEPGELLNPHAMRNHVSIDDLAEKILMCAAMDLSEISRMGRKVVEEDYSWDVEGPRWEKALVSV